MGQVLLDTTDVHQLEGLVAEAYIPDGEACAFRLDAERRVLQVRDRQMRTVYALGRKPNGQGYGWMAAYEEPQGWVGQTWALPASEPMAVVREFGGEAEVAELTLAAAEQVRRERGERRREIAERLRREVARGWDLELMAVRPIQAAVLRCQVDGGLTISDLCHRGGFLGASGDPDVSWLERRAGLKPEVCSRTGRRMHRRVVGYDVYTRLVAAVGGDPVDFGV